MKKRRIKPIVWVISGIAIVVIVGIVILIGQIRYRNSVPYKLKILGYTTEEVKVIETRSKTEIDKILKLKYSKSLSSLLQEKYFIFDNLDRYLAYQEKNAKEKASHVVSMVNVHADYEFYTNTKETDTSKGNLILVNKYNRLTEKFQPDDLVDISNQYAYGTPEIRDEVYKQFRSMFNAAKKDNITLIITSGYRDYAFQENLWNKYSDQKGEEWADSIAARAGFSEHQTGLSMDILTYNSTLDTFEQTDAFKWLSENAHKYGFILRYPKDKEEITGYSYESWHYRYVGVEVATKVKELGITFDEYYAYFIAQNKK